VKELGVYALPDGILGLLYRLGWRVEVNNARLTA
jgi:hypothetical protein